jgi:LysM repeat protein
MKSCSITRTVFGAGLVASFMLMQGCSYFGWDKKPEEQPPVIPTPETTEPVKVDPPVEIKPVAATTAYTIVSGDTISGVAANYGLRWQDVLAVNPGISPNKLRVGQVIQLPGQVDLSKKAAIKKSTAPKSTAPKTSAPKSAKAITGPSTVYVVKSGDSLGGIAYRHGVKVDAIRKANNMTNDKLSINQKLTIPGAKKADGSKAKTDVKKVDPVKVDVVPAPTEVKPVEVAPVAGTNSAPAPAEVTPPPAPAPADAGTVPAPAPAPAGNTQTYTVKEGEDLYAVAIRWGVSPSDLKALNNLTSTDLKAGMVLRIPASAQ